MNQPVLSKMYVAVLDDVPDYMTPTLIAHAVLSAHLKFSSRTEDEIYQDWLAHSFRKVIIRVNQKEFDKISQLPCHLAFESTILNAKHCCAVLYPMLPQNTPNVLKFAKMWKPKVQDEQKI
ncbi:Uncharacterised protein [Moraxella caprae]|uniref:Uncharacterized protein n=1 Tax=Moraxella caprae TaxID=90240 RepID=A0A378R115_9GAMM|nr:hypothetical protein [Moraxella caprae]STZ08895.1 Uncharacterised protein [Moraxella caprae]